MMMKRCLSGKLLDRIWDQKKLSETEVKMIFRQMLSAVEHLHWHGMVHKDYVFFFFFSGRKSHQSPHVYETLDMSITDSEPSTGSIAKCKLREDQCS